MRSDRFSGQVVMVTGAGSGLGKATALRFAAEGARVVVTDIALAAAEVVAAAANGRAVAADVTDAASVEAAVRFAADTFGGLNVLVNNAGVPSARDPIHAASLENWRRVTAVHLDGVFFGLKYGVAQMLAQGSGGAIVNVASTAALVAMQDISAYGAAKAGVVNLTRAAAVEYGAEGIRVNAVAPTAVVTPLFEQMAQLAGAAAADVAAGLNPLKGVVTAEDVASAIAFLASDDARAISGVVLPVDGGFSAR